MMAMVVVVLIAGLAMLVMPARRTPIKFPEK
jgi:hypothetical protein